MEVQAAAGEIARLEALLGADPAAPAFPALAEANRRAGRLEEAERVAQEGLRRRPELVAGRVALALVLLDLGRVAEARAELERALQDVPDHPLALQTFARAGGTALEALADDEIEGAFAEAETSVGEMLDANHVAAAALRAADLDEPEGVFPADPDSPFATRTVAGLLERQGHRAEAAALREELSRRTEPAGTLATPLADAQRERVIATLERWLELAETETMNFAATLRTIVDECGGGIGAALMGSDGISIEQVEAKELPPAFGGDAGAVGEEIAALGVEFGRILDEARKAADSLGGGPVEEACLRMARFWVLLRTLDGDTFLVLVLAPDGNLGKARFLMRRHLAELREHL